MKFVYSICTNLWPLIKYTIIPLITFFWGFIRYYDERMQKNAIQIENARPLISVISSSDYFIDLHRDFENKVVFDNEEMTEKVLSRQLPSSVTQFTGFGLFNKGGGYLRDLKMVIKYGNKEDCLAYPILDVRKCVFPLPEIFNNVLNNSAIHEQPAQLFISGTTSAGEKMYGEVKLILKRDNVLPISMKWIYVENRRNKYLNSEDFCVKFKSKGLAGLFHQNSFVRKYEGIFKDKQYTASFENQFKSLGDPYDKPIEVRIK